MISIYLYVDVITQPCSNFNGGLAKFKFRACINDCILLFRMNINTYPCLNPCARLANICW